MKKCSSQNIACRLHLSKWRCSNSLFSIIQLCCTTTTITYQLCFLLCTFLKRVSSCYNISEYRFKRWTKAFWCHWYIQTFYFMVKLTRLNVIHRIIRIKTSFAFDFRVHVQVAIKLFEKYQLILVMSEEIWLNVENTIFFQIATRPLNFTRLLVIFFFNCV